MAKIEAKILLLDEDQGALFTAKMILKNHFTEIIAERDPSKLDLLLSHSQYDVILLDTHFSYGLTGGQEAIKLLHKILRADPEAHVLMNTTYSDIDIAVEALNEGAIDFLVKPWPKEKLVSTIQTICQLSQTRKELNLVKRSQNNLSKGEGLHQEEIIINSSAMKELFKSIQEIAQEESNVLITGDYGTGKSLLARSIHQLSARADQALVTLDLASIPEHQIESELFGHTKGFEGANEDRPGKLELAHGGTLLLDGVNHLSLAIQAKLLTALQFKQVHRLGAQNGIAIDCRFICTTHQSLDVMLAVHDFRKDLYEQINTVQINIPSLRERLEDIEPIARHFLKIYGQRYGRSKFRLNQTTVDELRTYHWPGNVRELQNAVERAVMMAQSHLLAPEDFIIPRQGKVPENTVRAHNIENIEKQAIQNAIRDTGGNLSHAAKALGIGRSTLYRKMTKYQL